MGYLLSASSLEQIWFLHYCTHQAFWFDRESWSSILSRGTSKHAVHLTLWLPRGCTPSTKPEGGVGSGFLYLLARYPCPCQLSIILEFKELMLYFMTERISLLPPLFSFLVQLSILVIAFSPQGDGILKRYTPRVHKGNPLLNDLALETIFYLKILVKKPSHVNSPHALNCEAVRCRVKTSFEHVLFQLSQLWYISQVPKIEGVAESVKKGLSWCHCLRIPWRSLKRKLNLERLSGWWIQVGRYTYTCIDWKSRTNKHFLERGWKEESRNRRNAGSLKVNTPGNVEKHKVGGRSSRVTEFVFRVCWCIHNHQLYQAR